MQQQFRTVLQDFNSYPTKIQKYINEVQRGSPSLQSYITQIQKIISEPSESIISKILAMRFARDIMIMGRQDVVNKLKRLVPMLVKICSHRLESDDPNRGQSFFYYHPQYISCTKESKKKEIELQGSTFFVLCLESINKWAKWVPINSSGNQSEFSRGYNQLLERGVKFQNVFHYYKNSDTQKFKNTYKVEFFTQSQFDNNSQQSSRQLGSFSSKVSSITPEQIHSGQDIRQYLNSKDLSKNNIKQIDRLFKKTIDMYSNIKDFQHMSKQSKQEKEYMEKFIINYVMLQHKKINFSEFNRNMTTVELQLQQNSQILVEQPSKRMLKGGISNSNLRNPAPEANQYQQLLEKQEQSFNRKINFLKKELEDRLGDLKTIKGKHQTEMQEIKNQYESRIQLIKKGIIENSGQKTKYLIRENEALKEKMNQLQNREQVGSYYDTSLHHLERQKQLELDNLRLGRQVQELKIQNEKLKNMRKTGSSLKQPIRQSGTNSQAHELLGLKTTLKKLESQINTYKSNQQKLDTQMNKKNKKISNLAQQLKLYKNQLTDQREKHRKQLQKNNKIIKNLENQVKSYREKILHFEKKIDLKDIETAQLQEQIRLCKLMDRETNIMLKNINMEEKKGASDLSKLSRSPQNHQFVSPQKMLSSPQQLSKANPTFNFKYKKYQTLRNRLFAKNKEEWYRLVRCTLKQKDILFKQNQLQIGIIFNKVDINICEAVLFFTNMSQYQMDSLELEGNFGGSVYQHQRENSEISGIKDNRNQEIVLGSEFIFCLQSQQQQKISITVRKQEPITQIYQPIYLHIQFKKNNKNYKHRVIFPSFIFKSIQYCPIREHIYATAISDGRRHYQDSQIVINPSEEQYYSLKLIASTNIVHQAKCIPLYFPGLQKRPSDAEIQKYIGVASLSKLGVFFIVKLQLRKDNIMKIRLIPIHRIFQDRQLHQKQSQMQEQILRDYLSFIEFAFKK